MVERYIYDPFGQATVLDANWNVLAASAFAWVYLHQGGRYDVTSGLYHFRFRDYSPTLGRWTSLDPLRYAAGDVNLYRTVGNNPLNSLDPSGLFDPLSLDFAWGLLKGGAGEALGILGGLWDLITTRPWKTIANIYDGIVELKKVVENEGLLEAAAQVEPDLAELLRKWNSLEDERAGELIGRLAVKYGSLFIGGSGATKLINKLREAKRAKLVSQTAANSETVTQVTSVANATTQQKIFPENLPKTYGYGKAQFPGGWRPPSIIRDEHGRLTNGTYYLNEKDMAKHTTGSLKDGKSQFLYHVNEKELVLDAAAYADHTQLWASNKPGEFACKAKIVFDRPIGVHAETGQLTNVLNLYRTKKGLVHGCPGSPE